MIFIWINPFKGLGKFVCYFELRKMKEHLLDPWHHGDKLHPDIHD